MNLKSNILKISVVIALIFIIIPVIAAEDVDDSVYTESIDDSAYVESVDDSVYTESIDDSVYTEDANEETNVESDESVDNNQADETNDEDNENVNEPNDVLQDTETDENDNEVLSEGDDGSYEGQSADLQVSVIPLNKKVHVGDITAFGIFVKNNGPDTSYNVVVRARLLSGNLNILAGIQSKGYYEIYKGILYWYVGDLAPGENATLVIAGKVLSEKDIVLVADVTSDTPDPDLSNNIAVCFVDVVAEKEEPSQVMHATGNPIVLALLSALSVVGVSLRKKF